VHIRRGNNNDLRGIVGLRSESEQERKEHDLSY
jgi:hypothetical protein